MPDERPDVLLKSALEKIVYFEARSEQLQGELQAAREELSRLRTELDAARHGEVELRRELAGLEVRLQRAQGEREEALRVHDASKRERTAMMAKLLEASQIHHAMGEGGVDFDLASFISTLRGEVMARDGMEKPQLPITAAGKGRQPGSDIPLTASHSRGERGPSGPPRAREVSSEASLSPVARHAERLLQEGRLKVHPDELRVLSGQDASVPRTEETLFDFSVRELGALDGPARMRAAERLKALGQAAAAPALAAALHTESEPTVQVALLAAFASVASASGAAVVQPLLSARAPEVRIAALKTLLTLDPAQAAPHLSAAVKDPDRSVRRRASLLALGLEEEAALKLGEEAVKDVDPEVRGLAALALGATSGERARLLLLELLRDREPKVRLAAAQSLSRILGTDVSGMVHLDDVQRRREIRRLAGLPSNPVQAARPAAGESRASISTPVAAPGPTLATARAPSVVAPSSPRQVPAATPRPAPAPPRAHTVASAMAPHPASTGGTSAVGMRSVAVAVAPAPNEALATSLVTELRFALRGRTPQELSRNTGASLDVVDGVVDLLCARGHAVRRGSKVFLA